MRQLAQIYDQYGASSLRMQITLQSRFADKLSTVLGVSNASDELSLALADRSALGARLVKTLAAERLIAPCRSVPRDSASDMAPTTRRRHPDIGRVRRVASSRQALVRLQLLAELVFGDVGRAREWLHTGKKRLGGAAPIDFASDMLGYEAVENWLYEIDEGYFG